MLGSTIRHHPGASPVLQLSLTAPSDATICLPASLAAARALRDSVDRFEEAPAGPGRGASPGPRRGSRPGGSWPTSPTGPTP